MGSDHQFGKIMETEDKEAKSNRSRQRRMFGHYILIVCSFFAIVILFQKMNFQEVDTSDRVREYMRNLKVSSLRIEKLVTDLKYQISYDYTPLLKEAAYLKSNIARLVEVSKEISLDSNVQQAISTAMEVVVNTNSSIKNIIHKHKEHADVDRNFHSSHESSLEKLLSTPGLSKIASQLIKLEEQVLLYSVLKNEEIFSSTHLLIKKLKKEVKDLQGKIIDEPLAGQLTESIAVSELKLKKSSELNSATTAFLSTFDGETYDSLNKAFEETFSSESRDLNRSVALFYIVLVASWLHVAYLIYEILKRNGKIRRQTKELQVSLEQQKGLNDLQRKFVSVVSHEFRTPLAIIDSGAQKLIRRASDLEPENIEEVALKTRAHVNKLIELLDSILHSQRVDAGAMEIMPAPCDLKLIISDVCQLQYEIHTRNSIVLNITKLPSSIIADSKLISHVFTNLISNAVKYSPDGTEVHVIGELFDDYVEVKIKDSGVGIPAEELPDLFSCFYRASTSVGISGTGIGLHLVKNIIDDHGGSIEVESEVGIGSCFTVRLPLTQASYQAESQTVEEENVA